MSWTDDIRCLFCDGKLPLYRKITDGQFCTDAHRKAYWREHERLAVERLHQTHDSLRAYRPPGAIEAILGQPEVQAEPEVHDQPEVQAEPEVHDQPEIQAEPDVPRLGRFIPVRLALRFDVWPETTTADPVAYEVRSAHARPLFESLSLTVAPQSEELRRLLEDLQAWEDEQVPKPQARCAIPAPSPRESAGAPAEDAIKPLPAAMMMMLQPQLPSSSVRLRAGLVPGRMLEAWLLQAGLRRVPAVWAAQEDRNRARALSALEDSRNGSEALQFALTTPAMRPLMSLAPGTRYSVPARQSEVVAAAAQGPAEFPAQTPDLTLPRRKATATAAASRSKNAAKAPAQSNLPVPEAAGPVPGAAGLLPLRLAEITAQQAGKRAASVPSHGLIPQPPRTELMHPVSKLEPRDEQPASDLMPPPAVLTEGQTDPARRAHIWTHAADFLRHAPRDLKTLVFAIPVLLGLALHPALPKVRVSAPASASEIPGSVKRALNEQLVNVRQTMADRAGVALDEDFRSGLDDWVSRGDATAEWSFDATGFVRPGPLALYRPSLSLTDYELQFLGMIDKKALSWVVRAADFDNYYVVKLTVLKPGPLPTIGITRYAVVNGRAGSRVDTLAPIDARPDMLYRVHLDVQGDDSRSDHPGPDHRLAGPSRGSSTAASGSSPRGARQSRVRWVQVTHQYDMLGQPMRVPRAIQHPFDQRELVTMNVRKNGTETPTSRFAGQWKNGIAGAGPLGLAASRRQAQGCST